MVIIQAGWGQLDFRKNFKKLGKTTLIEMIVKRLSKSEIITKYGSNNNSQVDKKLIKFLKKKEISVFSGDEKNVLSRFFHLAKRYKPTHVVRVCGDCPFSDYKILDKMIKIAKTKNYDYISNTNPPTFPEGFDLEIFTIKALKNAKLKAKSNYDKEHVTPYIIRNSKNSYNFNLQKDYSKYRLTIDEPNDFVVIKNVFKNFRQKNYFDCKNIINLINKKPFLFSENMSIEKFGIKISNGQKLWSRAKMLYLVVICCFQNVRKCPSELLPTYFSKSKGCNVWDLDGKKYTDLASMMLVLTFLDMLIQKLINSQKFNYQR